MFSNIYSDKKTALIKFLDKYKHLPEQGSAEWLKSRTETIGGSEISTILNLNKYQNIKQLIQQKTGIVQFKKSAPLWFGSIFEFILQKYVEIHFNTTIYETGSIPYHKSNLIKYSPDGLAVINIKKLQHLFNSDLSTIFNNSYFDNSNFNNTQELLILFEFKNPFMRVINHNEIPVYYINQPKLGMEVINICDASIFIESIFRFCSYNDIISMNNKYNTYYHFDKIRYNNTPFSYGAFTLYYDKNIDNSDFHHLLSNIVEHLHQHNIHDYDLSAIKDKKIINRIMEFIIDYKFIKIIYHDICINSDIFDNSNLFYFHKYNNINKFKYFINYNKNIIYNDSKFSNFEYLGVMSFKMFDISIKPVLKSNPIDNNTIIKIQNVIDIIKLCNQTDNINDKKKIINNSNF